MKTRFLMAERKLDEALKRAQAGRSQPPVGGLASTCWGPSSAPGGPPKPLPPSRRCSS